MAKRGQQSNALDRLMNNQRHSPHNRVYFSHEQNKVLLAHTATGINPESMPAQCGGSGRLKQEDGRPEPGQLGLLLTQTPKQTNKKRGRGWEWGQSTKKIKQNIIGAFQLHFQTVQIRQVSKGRRWVSDGWEHARGLFWGT